MATLLLLLLLLSFAVPFLLNSDVLATFLEADVAPAYAMPAAMHKTLQEGTPAFVTVNPHPALTIITHTHTSMSAPEGDEKPKRGRPSSVRRQAAAAAATEAHVYSDDGGRVRSPQPPHPGQECLSQVCACFVGQLPSTSVQTSVATAGLIALFTDCYQADRRE